MNAIDDLVASLRARTPVVALEAPAAEELTTLESLALAIDALGQGHEVYTWSEAAGVEQLHLSESGINREPARLSAGAAGAMTAMNPVASVLNNIRDVVKAGPGIPRLFVLCDAHVHISGSSAAQSGAIRRIKELALTLKATAGSVVLLGEGIKLDSSLEGLVPTFTVGLPDAHALGGTLRQVIADLNGSPYGMAATGADRDQLTAQLVNAALGLTCEEFSDALRLAGFKGHGIDAAAVDVIRDRKLAKLRRLGADFAPEPDVSVGGLEELMAWVKTRRKLLTPEAVELGMPLPKGLLLVGVPGTGKSLVAKSIGAAWGLPVMTLDIGSLYGSLVGQTEQAVRKLLATADACAPCILLIDELEKALAGAAGHNGDSGTSQRLFGTLLSWMNDHKSQVFVVATANDVSRLPPELKRKGRFDEIFVVGLPTSDERNAILQAHLSRQGLTPSEETTQHLVDLTAGFTGAEIGAAVQTAKVELFCSSDDLELDAVLRQCVEQIEPQFKVKAYDVGDVNARPASKPEQSRRTSRTAAIR
jgi:hypothetical protein